MAISESLPLETTQGTVLEFKRKFSEFPVTEYTAICFIVDANGVVAQDPASAVDGYFEFAFPASAFDSHALGTLFLEVQATALSDSKVYHVERSSLTLKPGGASNADRRSHVKKVLDALEALLEGKASQDQLSYSIRGRSLSRMTPSELLEWRDKYKSEWAKEQRADRIKAGLGSDAIIRVRF